MSTSITTIHAAGAFNAPASLFDPADPWLAPPGARLPDFIICGAMKCGTTTLHHLLNRHRRISIPDGEIHFFDLDDHFEHSDYSFFDDGRWTYPDLASDPAAYWDWYSNFFAGAASDAILGEDSTCYLASPRAAQRIAMQSKPIKAIVCLRHPTDRAYSQYWHRFGTGKCLFNFEDTIRFSPHDVLGRSMYLTQLTNLLQHIPRQRVFVFVLEEFLANRTRVLESLLDFLGLSLAELPDDALQTHSNRAKLPRFLGLQLLHNRMLRSVGNTRYAGKLPCDVPGGARHRLPLWARGLHRGHRLINPKKRTQIPPMRAETRSFLDHYFQRELRGLDQLVGKDITPLWFSSGCQ